MAKLPLDKHNHRHHWPCQHLEGPVSTWDAQPQPPAVMQWQDSASSRPRSRLLKMLSFPLIVSGLLALLSPSPFNILFKRSGLRGPPR